MKKQEYFGMTICTITGHTYWQSKSFDTIKKLEDHVKRYCKKSSHLLIYKTTFPKENIVFVEHKNNFI
tara:strand:- start:1502 stop:1705 length:204 start_codon:yes stop_codon:yes gene_type:complete